jgi:hypothetical protein
MVRHTDKVQTIALFQNFKYAKNMKVNSWTQNFAQAISKAHPDIIHHKDRSHFLYEFFIWVVSTYRNGNTFILYVITAIS